jgi:squalene synthase HpnC
MVLNADAQPKARPGTPATGAPSSATSELEAIAAACVRKITTENYPVALRALPRRVREQLERAYAYARFVDDVGDEAAGDRLALLAAIDADLAALPHGGARLTPVRGMATLVREHGLSTQPLHDLVEANRRDQTITGYETFDELLDYCRLSAAPIGRIVLTLAGVDDAAAIERSDKICAALQVLEHCQDVREDAVAGRIYLPARDLRAAGAADCDLRQSVTTPELRRVIAVQVARCEQLLQPGGQLVRQLSGWARLAVLGYVAGGRATADALKRAHYDVLPGRVAAGPLSTAWHAALVLSGR